MGVLAEKSSAPGSLPESYTIRFNRLDGATHELIASQLLPLDREKSFTFFEDPRNLFDITPNWLDFRMADRNSAVEVSEGAEFDYTIRWFGIRMRWRSRIVGYNPPERFSDIQLVGPYRFWRHLHSFEPSPEGTRMVDAVTYRLPRLAIPLNDLVIKKQLNAIFDYRAVTIAAWARGEGR
ncbi:MAG: SRPBCC family protein [bacterium]|nr:SRPBCC family protein [bacterium]